MCQSDPFTLSECGIDFTARRRSLLEGNVLNRACLFVRSQGRGSHATTTNDAIGQ